ncbi:SRPBCC domain-containing protein [Paenibacillus sp. BSR1-1]|uniref:CoxG family protein n=1 Tax=Paenibacillus sp. BSR1-1 TaxID=3020845 RepID=UPI0025AF8E85|nr:SRPBCC domain-containing protein [Paenibacillus sp. BSR1-1]MDN3015408.1 SRPBCC domain-containing protein [Paenibacillus sp. BSR1-1]
MKINYDHSFELPRSIVWKYIKDENVLRNSLPGCRFFEERSTGNYLAEIEIQLGPIKDMFKLEIYTIEENSASSYRLHVKGKGNLGEISGNGVLHITENQRGTSLSFMAEAEITGALALASKRILDGTADKSLENFFQKMEKEIKKRIYLLKKRSR